MSCDAAMAVGRPHGGSRGRNRGIHGKQYRKHTTSGHRTVRHVSRRMARHAPSWAFRPFFRARPEERNNGTLALRALILAMTVAAAGPVATLFRDADPAGATRQLDPIITVSNSNIGGALLADTRCHPDALPGPEMVPRVGFATRAASCPITRPSLPISRAGPSPSAGRTTTTPAPEPSSRAPLAGNRHGSDDAVPIPTSMKTPQLPPAGVLSIRLAAGLRGHVAATRRASGTEDLVGSGR